MLKIVSIGPFAIGLSGEETLERTSVNRFPHLLEELQNVAKKFNKLGTTPTIMLVGPGLIKETEGYYSPQLFEVASLFPKGQLTIIEPNKKAYDIFMRGLFGVQSKKHYSHFMAQNQIDATKHPLLKEGLDSVTEGLRDPAALDILRTRCVMKGKAEDLSDSYQKSQILIIATFSVLYSLTGSPYTTEEKLIKKIDECIKKIMGLLKGNGQLIIDDNTFEALCHNCPKEKPKDLFLKEKYPDIIKSIRIIQPDYLIERPYEKIKNDIRGKICTIKGYGNNLIHQEDRFTSPIVVITRQPYKKTTSK